MKDRIFRFLGEFDHTGDHRTVKDKLHSHGIIFSPQGVKNWEKVGAWDQIGMDVGKIDCLASARAGQPPASKTCSIVPGTSLQSWHIPSLLRMSLYLVRDLTLALPDKYCACTTALKISYGFDPHVVKIGWVLERLMKHGLKYFREPSLIKRVWPHSFCSQ